MKNFKEELKAEAAEIRNTKIEIRRLQKNREYAGFLQNSIRTLKKNYRHRHIAYCLMRGRSYEQIESYCREKPDMDRIKEIMDEYKKEDVCVGA